MSGDVESVTTARHVIVSAPLMRGRCRHPSVRLQVCGSSRLLTIEEARETAAALLRIARDEEDLHTRAT